MPIPNRPTWAGSPRVDSGQYAPAYYRILRRTGYICTPAPQECFAQLASTFKGWALQKPDGSAAPANRIYRITLNPLAILIPVRTMELRPWCIDRSCRLTNERDFPTRSGFWPARHRSAKIEFCVFNDERGSHGKGYSLGIDLAKSVFSLHGVDGAGRWCCGARYGAISW